MVALFGRKPISHPSAEDHAARSPESAWSMVMSTPPATTNADPMAPPALPDDWRTIIDDIDHAFQPVVNIHSGHTYGIEALVRGLDRHGFDGTLAFLDAAHADGVLDAADYALKQKAIAAYAQWPFCRDRKLFLNIDAQVFEAPGGDSLASTRLLQAHVDRPAALLRLLGEIQTTFLTGSDHLRAFSRFLDSLLRIAGCHFGLIATIHGENRAPEPLASIGAWGEAITGPMPPILRRALTSRHHRP